jgi:tetratricopeptide (TPR) repeat protein
VAPRSPDPRNAEPLIYRVFALLQRWDYRGAIPLLSAYCAQVEADAYRLLLGQVNLLAALIFDERYEEAQKLAPVVLRSARRPGSERLLGNGLELAAQLALFRGELDRCESLLEEARELFRRAQTLDALYVHKWKAVLMLRRGKTRNGLRLIARVRLNARRERDWETLRDCDFHEAHATRDAALMSHVYCGTPHEAYRSMILRDSGAWFEPPAEYIWKLESDAPKRVLDVDSGMELGTTIALKAGQLSHRSLQVLASDFYRTHRPVALFGQLFAGEHFSPVTSVDRVHHVMMKTRRWLASHRIPLAIAETGGQYRLEGRGAYGLRRTLTVSAPLGPVESLLLRLRGDSKLEFGSGWVQARLGLSRTGAVRLLREALKTGAIEARGKGPARRYRWARAPEK